MFQKNYVLKQLCYISHIFVQILLIVVKLIRRLDKNRKTVLPLRESGYIILRKGEKINKRKGGKNTCYEKTAEKF